MTRMERTAALPLEDADLFRERALIGGAWVEAASGARVAVVDPATGATLGHVPDVSAAETRAAIEAAEAAFGPWRRRTHGERAALLEAWHRADARPMPRIWRGSSPPSRASRWPRPAARSRYGASFVKWFAEEARRIDGDDHPLADAGPPHRGAEGAGRGLRRSSRRGTFPNAMITRKVAPALAAGCTVVIKPSEFTPFSALALGVLAERAGIPAGVINIVTGMPAEIGAELTGNPAVRKISFTGSTRVGSLLMRQSPPTASSGSAWSSAATRPSSSSTTPISMRRWKARSPRSSATAARPASAPTASWCRPGSTTPSPSGSRRAVAGHEGRAGHRARRRHRPDDQRRRRREDRPPRRGRARQGRDDARPRRRRPTAPVSSRRWC